MTREEAIEFIAQSVKSDVNMALVADAIKALEQKSKTGHWISHREHCEMNNLRPSGLGSYFWCSECDCGIDSKYFHRVYYNYCPNCGRKME